MRVRNRKSSIHVEPAHGGEFSHNDRSRKTKNCVFPEGGIEFDRPAAEAVAMWKEDIEKKTKRYTERTGRRLHKNTKTLLSTVVNLLPHHKLEDVRKIADYLEKELGTKVYQIAVHRDEGYIDKFTGEKVVNHHAHILFAGLDEEGRSVRKKFTKGFLRKLQDTVASMLEMERGEHGSKRKRIPTYEFKRIMKEIDRLVLEKSFLLEDIDETAERLVSLLEKRKMVKKGIFGYTRDDLITVVKMTIRKLKTPIEAQLYRNLHEITEKSRTNDERIAMLQRISPEVIERVDRLIESAKTTGIPVRKVNKEKNSQRKISPTPRLSSQISTKSKPKRSIKNRKVSQSKNVDI